MSEELGVTPFPVKITYLLFLCASALLRDIKNISLFFYREKSEELKFLTLNYQLLTLLSVAVEFDVGVAQQLISQ